MTRQESHEEQITGVDEIIGTNPLTAEGTA